MFSALWIAAQFTLGPVIGQITRVHGVIQRLVGWLLMLILAELTGRFGRVTFMTAAVSLTTRFIRRSASVYPLLLGLGYALGGLLFDVLYFIPFPGLKHLKSNKFYVALASLVSGVSVLVPYYLFQISTLGVYVFIVRLPIHAYSLLKGVSLNILGTLIGLSVIPRIKDTLPDYDEG